MEPAPLVPIPPVPKPNYASTVAKHAPKKQIGILILAALVLLFRLPSLIFDQFYFTSSTLLFLLVSILPSLGVFLFKAGSTGYKAAKIFLIIECVIAVVGIFVILLIFRGLGGGW